jgi:hypothetical protein
MRTAWLLLSLSLCAGCVSGDGDSSEDDDSGRDDEGEESVDDDPAGDGDAVSGGEHPECERYIDCAREATPGAVTPLIAVYGEEGQCWSLPGASEADCENECKAGREALRKTSPTAACGDCARDEDCDGENSVCENFACIALGMCACPPGEPCDTGDTSDIFQSFPQSNCGRGLCPGYSCAATSECEPGLGCASYKGAPKVCTILCERTSDCYLVQNFVCSPERDSEGRGLCVAKTDVKCKADADCSTNVCRPDGSCGCTDDDACLGGAVCTR